MNAMSAISPTQVGSTLTNGDLQALRQVGVTADTLMRIINAGYTVGRSDELVFVPADSVIDAPAMGLGAGVSLMDWIRWLNQFRRQRPEHHHHHHHEPIPPFGGGTVTGGGWW